MRPPAAARRGFSLHTRHACKLRREACGTHAGPGIQGLPEMGAANHCTCHHRHDSGGKGIGPRNGGTAALEATPTGESGLVRQSTQDPRVIELGAMRTRSGRTPA